MKIIFMGTPDFSVGTLEALIEAGHEVCLVVTQPDKPKGRGKEMQPTPVKAAAMKHGIPVYQPKKIRDPECVEELRKYQADVMVVIAFGQILPKSILEMTPYGCINVHASLLPKYRGAAPIQWAIINGESVTGVTTMQMDEGLDTGDMIQKTEVEITPDETGESLHDKLAAAGAALCVETLKAVETHTATFEKQGESPTAYARMLDKKLGNIDWSRSAVEIDRLVRGLNSWPSSYTLWVGKVMKIWKAKAEPGAGVQAGGTETEKFQGESQTVAGTVVAAEKDSFTVQTGEGRLKVLQLQIPGKKPVRSRNQLLLDFSRKEVRDEIFKRICAVLDQGNVEYIKWDMNRSLADIYAPNVTYDYVLGVYDFLEKLTNRYPDILIEGCSGGGGRYDAGMMYYSPQIWCSDNTDAINRLSIQYGSSFFYPICTVGSHVSVCPNHQTGRVTPFRTRGDVALAGSFGYEMDLNKISEEEKEMVKEQVAAMHEYYELTHEGLYYRLTGLKKQDFMAWEFVAKDQSRALLTIVKTDAEGNMLPVHTKVCGLAEDKLYRCSLDQEVRLGRTWNRAGLTLHQVLEEYESIRVEFTEVK